MASGINRLRSEEKKNQELYSGRLQKEVCFKVCTLYI